MSEMQVYGEIEDSQYVQVLSHFSHVWLFVTPWIIACQAPLSMEFSRQNYWSGLPCPLPGDLPNPGTEPISLMSPALIGGFFNTSPTWEANKYRTPQQKSATIWAWGAPNIQGLAKRANHSLCSSSSPQVSYVPQSYSIIRITCGVWKENTNCWGHPDPTNETIYRGVVMPWDKDVRQDL